MKKILFLLVSVFCLFNQALADDVLTLTADNNTITENFDGMWDAATSTATLNMPAGWRIDRQMSAPRMVGTYSTAATEVMYTGGVSLASNAKNGTWNFGSSATPSDRAIGGLSTTVDGGTRCINVMTQLANGGTLPINQLNISYDIEKYRNSDNDAGFTVQLYYSADGITWKKAGDDFKTDFPKDDATIGAEVVPITTTTVSNKQLNTAVAVGSSIYLAWNISVSSGTSPNKAMGLALDNISLTASFGEPIVDPDQTDPTRPPFVSSGIFVRGEVNGWGAITDWEFSDEGEGTYVLYDKEISGAFKVADADWSSSCNYGSNGTAVMMDSPYSLVLGTNDNISCGGNTYTCKRIVLTISNGVATLLFESDDDDSDLTSVYVIGDNNGWNYMDKSGELRLDASDNLFKGQVSLSASADGMSHWRIYQRLGMSGPWGAPNNEATTGNVTTGNLEKGSTASISTEPGTYDFTFDITTGTFTLTKLNTVVQSVTLMPADVTLVPQLPEKVKVLSLNNSLIHYNDQAAMFNDIAAALGKDAHWTKHTMLGKPLSTHWEEGDGLGGDGQPSAKMLIRTEAWSHIILQEQSGLPRTDIEAFRRNVKQWVSYIREYCPNPNAIIIVPMNWAYSGDWANFTDYNNKFYANYMDVARETGVTICPVGVAYQMVYNDKGADGIAPWFQDDRHPTDMSTYMAACMEYGLIFGENPATITYHPESVSDADATEMRAYASKALSGFTNIVDHTAATIRFTAVTLDQFGMEIDAPGDIVFTVSDGGTIDDNHVFTSNGTEGVFGVTAKNNQFETKATVKVAHAETEVPVYPAIELNADKLSAEQDFDMMGTAADATLPEGWRIDRQTSAPRVVGSYAAAQDNTMYAGGTSLPSNAKNGIWNFGQDDNSDRAIGGISTGVADGTRCVNIYAHFMNTGQKNIENLHICYDIEKYRKGSNPAGFTIQMYYSIDGRNWVSAGNDFCTMLDPDAATEGYASVPGEVIPVSAVLNTKMQPSVDFYLAWNITVTSGDAANNAMALAIDNFKLTGELPETPTAQHYIYVIDETGYDALGLYAWGDSELFGAWPGESSVDEKTIDGNTYKVFLLDANGGSYSLIFNNWNNGKQVPDFGITADRDYYLRVTATDVTEINPTTAIQNVSTNMDDAQNVVFDLQGRKVGTLNNHLSKGIYIVNGKKCIIK